MAERFHWITRPGQRIETLSMGKNLPVVKFPLTAFHHFLAILQPLPAWRSVWSMKSLPCFLTHWEIQTQGKQKRKATENDAFKDNVIISLRLSAALLSLCCRAEAGWQQGRATPLWFQNSLKQVETAKKISTVVHKVWFQKLNILWGKIILFRICH